MTFSADITIIERIANFLGDFISKHNGDLVFLVCFGGLVLGFLISLLFCGGMINKFPKPANALTKALKENDEAGIKAAADKLPGHVRQRFYEQQATGGNAEELLSYEICVKRTMSASMVSKAPGGFKLFLILYTLASYIVLSLARGETPAALSLDISALFPTFVILAFGFLGYWALIAIRKNKGKKAALAFDGLLKEIDRQTLEKEEAQAAAAPVAPVAQQATASAYVEREDVKVGAPSASIDELIERINKMAETGGSLSEIRACQKQLKEERRKPDNQGVDTQRKLNDALAVLITVMNDME